MRVLMRVHHAQASPAFQEARASSTHNSPSYAQAWLQPTTTSATRKSASLQSLQATPDLSGQQPTTTSATRKSGLRELRGLVRSLAV
jgi:hypothetical protein